ncbi:MAG: hypothetical protein HY302_16950 [Opitutae bacterium]|nr:hypothetical protein [Opitutae bacterium]
MITPLKNNYEKLLLGCACALLAAGTTWAWLQQPLLGALRRQAVAAPLSGPPHAPALRRAPEQTAANWAKPAVQSYGPGWVYEVFTPPVIYYHTVAKTFTVTPPLYFAEGLGPVFGLELLAVKLEAYRLQLVGYFGAPGHYIAAFVSPAVADTFLAREGRRFEGLGLTLKNFTVKKILVEHNDPWPVYDIAAQAVLHDEQTGREVLLDSRARKLTDTPLAVLRLANGTDKPREFREGDTLADESGSYRVERIQLDPPEVVVARTIPGLPLPETKILRPPEKSAGSPPEKNIARQSPDKKARPPAQPHPEFAAADGK